MMPTLYLRTLWRYTNAVVIIINCGMSFYIRPGPCKCNWVRNKVLSLHWKKCNINKIAFQWRGRLRANPLLLLRPWPWPVDLSLTNKMEKAKHKLYSQRKYHWRHGSLPETGAWVVELSSCCSFCDDSVIGDVRSSTVRKNLIRETVSNTGLIVEFNVVLFSNY